MTRRADLDFRYPRDGEPHQDLIVYTLDRP